MKNESTSRVKPSTLAAQAARMLATMSVLTGVLYPLLVTAGAQALFPDRANGSLVVRDGKVVGSQLVGQSFESPKYFWGRLSATGPAPYNAGASAGTNLGPLNAAVAEHAKIRIAALRAAEPDGVLPVPVDLVTASASGLDPHISPAAADYQVRRVARARALPEDRVRTLVRAFTEPPDLGVLGEPRVNVLALNLALDDDR